MKAIGVRELRQRASAFLKQVETGATVEVTSRGRTIARLIPVRQTSTRDRLIAQGRLVPGAGDALAIGAPLRPNPRTPLPGVTLLRARANER